MKEKSFAKIIPTLLLTILISLLLIFSAGCHFTGGKSSESVDASATTQSTTVRSLTFVKLPSPPHCKRTNNKTIIDEILQTINKANKQPLNLDDLPGGWSILITLDSGLQISVAGNQLTIGSEAYRVADDFADKLLAIYNRMSEQEVDYP